MAENKTSLSLVIKAVDKATGPLREVNAQIAKATAPVRALSNGLKALSKEAGLPGLVKGFSGVGSAVGKVGREAFALGAKIAGLAAVAGFGLFRIVKGAVDAGDKLSEMAERTGLAVDAYAQLQFAAAQADVDQEQFNGSMDQFNKRLGEAKAGTGPLLAFFKKVSPAFAKQLQGAKTTEEAFNLMTKAMEKVEDPGKRAAMAAAAFGRSGLQMGQFLGKGTAAIGEQRKKFFALAGSQEDFANGSSDLDNALRDTEIAFLGLRNAAVGALFPALTELAKALSEVLAGNRGKLAEWAKETGAALSAWVKGGGLDRLVVGLKEIASAAVTVANALGGLKGVAIAIAAIMSAPLVSSILGVISAMFTLGGHVLPMLIKVAMLLAPMFQTIGAVLSLVGYVLGAAALAAAPFIVAALAVAAAGYQIWKNWADIKMLVGEAWDYIAERVVSAWAVISPIIDKLGKAMSFTPIGLAIQGASFVGKKLFGAEESRPMLGAASATAPGGGVQKSQAHVTVDFNNVPKGTRVTPAKGNTAPLDLSVGPSMVTP